MEIKRVVKRETNIAKKDMLFGFVVEDMSGLMGLEIVDFNLEAIKCEKESEN